MTHAERRLNHTLADWVSEKVHASTERDDDALLAALQAEMTSKVAATFRRQFPKLMGPC